MTSASFETRISSLFAIALLVCTVLACNFSRKLLSNKNMFEGNTAKEAGDAFKAKLGGGPVKALSLQLEKDVATLRAQDPQKPQNVDEYKYTRGIVVGPNPVQLNSLERNLNDTLFDLDEVNLAATEALAKQAVERTQLEGGQATAMTIERGLNLSTSMTKSGAVRWHVTVQGTRETASATADVKGNILGLDLSQTSRAASFTTYSAETLRDAGPMIKQAFGGRVRLVELTIYEKFVMFKALSPSEAGQINQYKYDINGVTTNALANAVDPTPIAVRMSGHKLEDFVFDLDEIKLETALDFGKKALDRLGYADGQVSLYKVAKAPRSFGSKELVTLWTVSCKQGRKSGTVLYDLAGNEVRVSQR